MEDFILKPKRILLLGYLFLGILMTLVGYFCFVFDNISYSYPPIFFKIVGLIGVIFFGLCTIIIFIKLLTAKPILIVNKNGIFCFDILIPWSFIKGFSIYNVVSVSFVIIEVEKFDFLYQQLSFFNKVLIKNNIPFIGKNFYIQSQGTNILTSELRDILLNYKETYQDAISE